MPFSDNSRIVMHLLGHPSGYNLSKINNHISIIESLHLWLFLPLLRSITEEPEFL